MKYDIDTKANYPYNYNHFVWMQNMKDWGINSPHNHTQTHTDTHTHTHTHKHTNTDTHMPYHTKTKNNFEISCM